MTPEQIRALEDPAERAREAEGFIRRARVAITEVQEIRDEAVVDLATTGWSVRRIGRELDLSPARAAQLVPKASRNGHGTGYGGTHDQP